MGSTMTATRIDRGSTPTTTIYSEGGDLVFERTFDAPRERVWQAFTDPEIVPRWWGKHGTTTTVAEMDVRPGGKWRYISSAPDRDDVAFYGEYLSITPPEGFDWTFMFDVDGVGPQGGPESHRFEDLGGRTKVVSVGHMGSPEILEGALATGMAEGAIETWDRLAAVLADDCAWQESNSRPSAGPALQQISRGDTRYLPPSVRTTVAFCQDAPFVSALPSAASAFSARSLRHGVPVTGFVRILPASATSTVRSKAALSVMPIPFGAGQMIPLTSLSCQV